MLDAPMELILEKLVYIQGEAEDEEDRREYSSQEI